MVHVSETKPTLVPEQSENIEQLIPTGASEPLPGARRLSKLGPDALAVRASADAGVDLWADRKLARRLFFSDRPKRAIKDAKIKSRGLDFVAAKVLP